MSSVTEPVVKAARLAETARGAKEMLDALAAGTCDQTQFFRGVADLLQRAPDAGWELLGLVDQYYRRGKISAQAFSSIKTRLQGLLVGKGESDEISNPTPRMQGEPTPNEGAPPAVAIALARRAHTARNAATGPPLDAAAKRQTETHASPAAVASHMLESGDLIRGRYLIRGLLGRGGMGVVYAAIDQFRLDPAGDDQKVALKVLHTEVIKRPRLFAELRREFQHLQSLSHPNIVRVHEFDRDGDLAFFTMEYLSGTLLSQVLPVRASSTLQLPYGLAIVRDVGSAIEHAHARGVVHGDLNPGNIFITDSGEIRVLDFGASHPLHRVPWISEFANHERVAVATPGFASCQVLEGETADARDDVYALGCIAYVLLTGNHPYRNKTPLHARTLRLQPHRPRGLTNRQWNALRAALDFDRDRRPSNVGAWLERLDLRKAAPQLPPLVSIRTARARRRGNARPWKQVAAAVLIVTCGWFALVNVNSFPEAGDWITAKLKTVSAYLLDNPLWQADPVVKPQPGPPSALPPQPEPVNAAPMRTATSADPTGQRAMAAGAARASSANSGPSSADGTDTPVSARGITTAATGVPRPAAQYADAARGRLELTADTVEVASADSIAQIVVRRSRSLRGEVTFTWWTESGTAKPGRDFVPVNTHVEHMDSGQSAVNLVIPVVVDPARRESRSFYVVIDEPSDNATLGSRTLAMVTLPGSEPASGEPEQ